VQFNQGKSSGLKKEWRRDSAPAAPLRGASGITAPPARRQCAT